MRPPLAVLQARMSSTRLPGKVMRPLLGEPMIWRQIERLMRCRTLGSLVVATSVDPTDDPLAACLEARGVSVFRGDLHDVLGRFAGALAAFGPAERVVRLTADCPLVDPDVVDAAVTLHADSGADYVSNSLERTFPRGLDVEVASSTALRAAALEARDPYEREHVTPFLYRRPERFTVRSLVGQPDLSRHRWTVDTADDFSFVERVYAALHPGRPDFGSDEVLALPFSRFEP